MISNRLAARGADRIAVASERHRAVISRIHAEQAHRVAALDTQAAQAQGEADHVDAAADDFVNNIARPETEEQNRFRDFHMQDSFAAAHATRKHRQDSEAVEHRAEQDYKASVEAAGKVIQEHAAFTRAELDGRHRHRERIQSKCHRDIVAAQKNSDQQAASAREAASIEVLRTEVTRHRAGVTVALAHESAQALRTVAQEKVLKTTDAGIVNADILVKESHAVRKACDKELGEQMHRCANELEAAKERCHQVKNELADEAADYKRRMVEIEGDAEANAKEVARKIRSLEDQRLAFFNNGNRLIKEAEASFRGRRDHCEGEFEAVHRRLRTIEDETRDRAAQMLVAWRQGNTDTEVEIQELEKDGEQTIEALRKDMDKQIKLATQQYDQMQHRGMKMFTSLEKQAGEVIDNAQPELDSTRYPEDEAMHEARTVLRQMKPLPEEMRENADKQIEALEIRADVESQKYVEAGEVAAEAGKRASKRAREEEEWLQHETADAWARIRHACYQLRLFNLHDFAKAISEGAFDLTIEAR